jgi:hypothetical protein
MPDYVLEIVEGPEAGRQIPLPDQPFEIGRDGVGVELKGDELVSRAHVRVTPTGEGATVEDLDSRNGTFVNGDEIHSPAYLAPGGQLLVGVTLLELRRADELRSSGTAVRPLPSGFTSFRPLASAEPSVTAVRQVPSLAKPATKPDYVPDDLFKEKNLGSDLDKYLDTHTKNKARAAPIALFVLVALVVMVFLTLRNERADANSSPTSLVLYAMVSPAG